MKPGRNDPCHCGSGKKYKKCHEAEDAAAESKALAAQAAAREKDAEPARAPARGKSGGAPGKRAAAATGPHPKDPPPKGPSPVRRRAV